MNITHETEHDQEVIRAHYSRIGTLGGRSKSPAKLAAVKRNLTRIKLTTAQRKANAVKGRLTTEEYRENARRTWAKRKAQV